MPTYEYQCKKCGYRFEKFQSMTELPVKKCPECKGSVRKMIGTGAGLIFKGKGFYQTDYKSTGSGTKKQDDKNPAETPCGKPGPCGSCAS